MTFTYDHENAEGEIITSFKVDALFTPYVRAKTSGDPDDCYPAEGGELYELTVWDGDRNITDTIDPDTLDKIAKEANYRWDPVEEARSYDDR